MIKAIKVLLVSVMTVLAFTMAGLPSATKASAATTQSYPNHRARHLEWHNEGGPKTSNKITTTRSIDGHGWICVDANFDDGPFDVLTRYHWYIEEYVPGRGWVQERQSTEYNANGNLDHACYDNKIEIGKTYRVLFDPTRSTYMKGTFHVYGYFINYPN
jgi:hypothetical protein